MTPAVLTGDLGRTFTAKPFGSKSHKPVTVTALSHVNLEIPPGELFGLLGPNGAGKTTLIRILSTLLLPSYGKAFVGGYDIETHPQKIRSLINMVSGGETSGYGMLTARESLWLFTQFYGIPYNEAFKRIDYLLKVVGLEDRANVKLHDLSTGMRQKVNFARGFLNNPSVLFLDEPTLGLDVHIARGVRTFIKEWMKEEEGRTILLTTHYLQEAEQLCDRVAIISDGKIIACDTPDGLKKLIPGRIRLELVIQPVNGRTPSWNDITGLNLIEEKEADNEILFRFLLNDEGIVHHIMNRLVNSEARILSLKKHEPDLEDVFVAITGKKLCDDETAEPPEIPEQ
ncbi:MAG: ABC transporter ATP-binding protein [Chloroflexi bacterium]|nr:ABC transporter ATP-binding protein [Chloroflexota bacterium]